MQPVFRVSDHAGDTFEVQFVQSSLILIYTQMV